MNAQRYFSRFAPVPSTNPPGSVVDKQSGGFNLGGDLRYLMLHGLQPEEADTLTWVVRSKHGIFVPQEHEHNSGRGNQT